MQLPLPLHTEAQRIASSLPAPPVIRSTMAAVGLARIRVADPGRLDHRAGTKALAAAGTGIGDRLSPCAKLVEIPGRNTAVAHHPLPIVPGRNSNWGGAEALVQIANGSYHEPSANLLAEATIMATNDPLCD